MSQYTSRFYIIVKDTSEWRRLTEDYDLEKFGLYIPDDYDKKTYYMDDTCILEIDLDIFVEFIMNCLGKDVLVIADTTNYNVDPYNYCVYLINGKMKTKENMQTKEHKWLFGGKQVYGNLQKKKII